LEERHLMKREKGDKIMMLHTKTQKNKGILAFPTLKRSPLTLLTSNDDERGVGCLGNDVFGRELMKREKKDIIMMLHTI